MRKIKFRGRTTKGKWLYGDLQQRNNGIVYIAVTNEGWDEDGIQYPSLTAIVEVNPDTVSQFTGLHDKNGKEIYEGDIIRTYGSKGDEIKHTVCYSDKEAMFCTKLIGADMLGGSITQRWLDEFEFEVIGNVHDNPELLKGNKE